MYKFCVPADFIPQTVLKINTLNNKSKKGKVFDFYGTLNPSYFSSSRPSKNLPIVNIETLKQYITVLKTMNFNFNYVMNAQSYAGIEMSELGKKKILYFIEKIVNAGVENIILANPYIIVLCNKYFPNLKIITSTILRVDSIMKLKFYYELGAKRFILWEDANRDFKFIQKAIERYELEIMVNSGCMFGCPMRDYHYNIIGHQNTIGIDNNWIVFECGKYRVNNPVEILKARGLIRPSDISYYDSPNIYFKIVGRTKSSRDILNLITAYLNMDDFLFEKILKNTIYFKLLDMKISKLDGFLDFFYLKKNPCDRKCINCNYCDGYVNKCFSPKNDSINKFLINTNQGIDSFLRRSKFIEYANIFNKEYYNG
ncbi:U32 family peptidase [Treponema denticola]|uniref:U32 family peptidase n=1 Tax=Treponema denticola TaxID=158 RepID=UPI003D913D41